MADEAGWTYWEELRLGPPGGGGGGGECCNCLGMMMI